MRNFSRATLQRLITLSVTLVCASSSAALYHVSPAGSDTNSGTEIEPWRSIQRAVNVLQAGDTVLVAAGLYDERVLTARGGTSETNRITVRAIGQATLRGFEINHPFVTVDGFDVTGHSAFSPLTGYIRVSANGDHFRVLNNRIRDGISIVRSDLVFSNVPPAPPSVSSVSGGFLAAGFKPGMFLYVLKSTNSAALANASMRQSRVIANVTDNLITFTPEATLTNEGPVLAYLDASLNYGLVVLDGAAFGIARGNTFTNLDYDATYIGGESNLYEANNFHRCNGWDVINFFGNDNVYRRNVIQDSPVKTYSNISPDAFEPAKTSMMYRLVFEANFVIDFEGVLSAHTGAYMNLVFRGNVFVRTGIFAAMMPNMSFFNNTFYQVSLASVPVAAAGRHPLILYNGADLGYGGGAIKNNIFVGCGLQASTSNGWYQVPAIVDFAAAFNFVSGDLPLFSPKVGFNEPDLNLNGGDPGFTDLGNPLGPDGVPFSDDDGLRLREDSKLRGLGEGGLDPGAYARPRLGIRQEAGNVKLSWSASADYWMMQAAFSNTGPWFPIEEEPVPNGEYVEINVSPSNAARFFRLYR